MAPSACSETSLFHRSLALSGQIVIECDEGMAVVAEHGCAEGLTRGGRLVGELEAAVRARLGGASHPWPFARLPEHRLLEVERTPSGRVLVWLRHQARSRALLSRQLRERYGFKLRSQQLLALVAQGLKNKEIAEQLGLREATVKTYLHQVYETLGVRSRTQAIAELSRTLPLEPL